MFENIDKVKRLLPSGFKLTNDLEPRSTSFVQNSKYFRYKSTLFVLTVKYMVFIIHVEYFKVEYVVCIK